MKICIPTQDDRGMESRLFDHFGSAPFFAMVNVDNGRLDVVNNLESDPGSHSCHNVDRLTAHDVDVVVCKGVGRRAFAALNLAGIDVWSPEQGTVGEILEAVRAGQVRRLTADDACGGGRHGGNRVAGSGHGRCNCHHGDHGHDQVLPRGGAWRVRSGNFS